MTEARTQAAPAGPDIGARLTRLIAATGPISIAQYMAEANAAYYAAADPLGQRGDFITAPEISQMFGEMIGLWLTDLWQRAGAPADAAYVELGPGRGTLARDALRAAGGFGFRPDVHFVETSPALRTLQREAIPKAAWHDGLSTLPGNRPLLIVANEFFDALPVRQLVRTPQGWRERQVGLDGDRFVPVAGAMPMDAAVPPGFADAPDGAILETSPAVGAYASELALRLADQPGALLIIDYGYAGIRLGSTLQAVRRHKQVDPFAAPGAADLTAHVDFESFARVAYANGLGFAGPVEQGSWLGRLGIGARAEALVRADPEQAGTIASALRRLTDPDEMGALFKVCALTSAGWPRGEGFATPQG